MSGRPSLLRRTGQALLGPGMAVVVALIISAIVIALIGEDPLAAVRVMADLGDSPSQQVQSIVVILNRAVPLFLSGLAVAVAFRMGLFNIGVEGQYRLATILAAAVGAAVVLPGPLHVLLIVVVAMVVGALWAGIVGVLKVTRGVDVGAQAVIWELLKDARAEGLGIVLISADLDELIGLSDTLMVMLRGRLVATLDPRRVTPEELGGYMTGARTTAGAA